MGRAERMLWVTLAIAVTLLGAGLVWRSLLPAPPSCPSIGGYYSYEHGRCVGAFEFDRRS
jgi:hypothetical protein